jgi:hypothetical protein
VGWSEFEFFRMLSPQSETTPVPYTTEVLSPEKVAELTKAARRKEVQRRQELLVQRQKRREDQEEERRQLWRREQERKKVHDEAAALIGGVGRDYIQRKRDAQPAVSAPPQGAS